MGASLSQLGVVKTSRRGSGTGSWGSYSLRYRIVRTRRQGSGTGSWGSYSLRNSQNKESGSGIGSWGSYSLCYSQNKESGEWNGSWGSYSLRTHTEPVDGGVQQQGLNLVQQFSVAL